MLKLLTVTLGTSKTRLETASKQALSTVPRLPPGGRRLNSCEPSVSQVQEQSQALQKVQKVQEQTQALHQLTSQQLEVSPTCAGPAASSQPAQLLLSLRSPSRRCPGCRRSWSEGGWRLGGWWRTPGWTHR